MSDCHPNEAIKELESVLGRDSTQEIVRLYLKEFPEAMRRVLGAPREEQQRIVHGLKSSSNLMGSQELSLRLAAMEEHLGNPGTFLDVSEVAQTVAEFDTASPQLREYAGE